MRKILVIAFIVTALAFAGSAHALALYEFEGDTYYNHVVGFLGIEGVDSLFNIEKNKTYYFFYDWGLYISYPDGLPYPGIDSHYDNEFVGTWNASGPVYVKDLPTDTEKIENYLLGMQWGNYGDVYLDSLETGFKSYNLTQINQPAQHVRVPEPSGMLLFASGLLGLGAFRKKTKSTV